MSLSQTISFEEACWRILVITFPWTADIRHLPIRTKELQLPFSTYYFVLTPNFGDRRARERGSFCLHPNYKGHNQVTPSRALCLQLTMQYYTNLLCMQVSVSGKRRPQVEQGYFDTHKGLKDDLAMVSCCGYNLVDFPSVHWVTSLVQFQFY